MNSVSPVPMPAPPDATPEDEVFAFPLSFPQQRMWILHRLEPGISIYNIAARFWLRGPLDLDLLTRAINAIVRRHESLRTFFDAPEGQPVQLVAPELELTPEVIDLRHLPAADRLAEAKKIALAEARTPFDLTRLPLVRVRLIQTDDEEHVFLWTIHHIIADGWSIGVTIRELSAHYESLARGTTPMLPPLAIQYPDYSVWQQEWLATDDYQRQLGYWRGQLAGCPAELDLMPDRPLPDVPTFDSAIETVLLPRALFDGLEALSRSEGATLFMTLLAGYQALLHRRTGETDLVVGAPIANRGRVEIEPLIGFFVNTLVMRTDVSGDPTFRELLGRVRETAVGAFAHAEMPFERLVEELQPPRARNRNPFFQTIFYYHKDFVQPRGFAGLNLTSMPSESPGAMFDLNIYIIERAEGLRANIDYSRDLYDAATIRRMLAHLQRLLEAAVANPDTRLSELPLMPEAERRLVVEEWNATASDYPRDASVAQLFEEQSAQTPDATALVFDGGRLTYAQLNVRADALAGHLADVPAGSLVGLCVPRSPETIAAMLTILKAGHAYVPLDPAYPAERLAWLIEDTRMPAVFTTAALTPLFKNLPVRALDVASPAPKSKIENRKSKIASVIYTSGSTGTPKGVLVSHRGIARLVKNTDYADFGPEQVFLQSAPITFDASTFEIWGPLLNGGTLALLPPGEPSLAQIGAAIQCFHVTTLWLTAGLFHLMIDERPGDLRPLRQLLAGGDILSPAHVAKALAALPDTRLINGYGPTENTTFTCCHTITAADLARPSIPIGGPIANTQVFILDEHHEPVPIGVPGDLFIAGDGLALGYHARPELTAERFLPNSQPPLYAAGDRARWLPDGTIEFLGRRDRQLKVRGFRIEPGEIEHALCQHPRVSQSAVTAHGQGLAAYVVGGAPAAELRAFLRTKLPDYMIPSAFVALDALPLTPNGKVDLRALPAPDAAPAQDFHPPATPDEIDLAKIWERLLHRQPIGRHDNFFDLGGHSLLALQLFHEIEKRWGKALPLATLFRAPTLDTLAALLAEPAVVAGDCLVAIQPLGGKPPIFCIHGGDGGVLLYRDLARALGEERPFCGMEADYLVGRDDIGAESIEHLAAAYIRRIQNARPTGPYHLAGYSLGGVIAFEMAQQLRRAGAEVGLVALLDTYNPARPQRRLTLRERIAMNRELAAGKGIFGTAMFVAGRVGDKIIAVLNREIGRMKTLAARFWAGTGHDLKGELSVTHGREEHVAAMRRYEPREFDGSAILFVADNPTVGYEHRPDRGWDGLLSRGLDLHRIDGAAHEAILLPPAVEKIADRMRAALADA